MTPVKIMKLPKTYEPQKYEADIYKLWESSGAFKPTKDGEPYSIVLPPPNATGRLHVGHAAMLAIEDCVVRYQRMRGKSVLWVPGTDHAAIATNAIMEKQLESEGQTKHDIGREEFLKRLTAYVEDSKSTIRTQVRAMGASVDWSRERYTMEPAMNRIVSLVFIKMFEDGLIYRGHRIVNWDPKMQTTVADDEVEYVTETSPLYTLKYGPFEITTARPETKFGDKYVVMHPDDKRYAQYKEGDTFEADWLDGKVTATVIKDEAIDPSFGTGVMTITPWHDATDFDIAERHKLDKEQIIDNDGKLMDNAGEFKGLTIQEARPAIIAKLQDKGLVVKADDKYSHNVAVNYRGKGLIEPQIKEQWFVDVNKPVVHWKGHKRSLKEVMLDVVKDGDIKILPERFDKTYFHWIENLRDWCVSRQIWWGHRIPVWYRDNAGQPEVKASLNQPEGEGWKQDPDTLDTWFSSALWSWSTLIEPDLAIDESLDLSSMLKKSADYKRFHPTTLMETGYDILFFWVARMILMTTYVTGQIPFKTVYLHGLVRTKDGSKMSKSHPESIIDPLDMISKYGTDALRLSMMVGQAPGHDMRLFEDKVAGYRNFCNKLWNIARFVEDKIEATYRPHGVKPVSPADHWILARLGETLKAVEAKMEGYELGQAYELVYHFIWDDFADWYIEASKIDLNQDVLIHVLEATLHMTHPFAPYVTETIWETLEWESSPLISSPWPKAESSDAKTAGIFNDIMTVVREVRYLHGLLGTEQNHLYYSESEFLETHAKLIAHLARLEGVNQVAAGKGLHLTQTTYDCWIDVEERKIKEYLIKLTAQREEQHARIKSLEARLANKDYMRSAPSEIVDQTKAQLTEVQAHAARVDGELKQFNTALGEITDETPAAG